MGANSHTNYACARPASRRSPRSTPSWPRRSSPILGTTYGLIVYQEQVHADRAEGRRLHPRARPTCCAGRWARRRRRSSTPSSCRFSEGMRANGYSDAAIKTLWDILVPFSDYAFNKAHTAAYGLVSYWTAYLKANYPAEYMAALLTSVRDDKDKSALYLNECRRMGIKVLPPDVNESLGQLHRRRHRHPLRPRRDPQRRHQRRRRRSSRRASDKGASPRSRTSSARCRRWSATSAPSSR